MEHRDKEFDGKTIPLDGNTFTGCTFRNCCLVLEAAGETPPDLGANRFEGDCALGFKGKGAAGLHLLAMLYHRGGEGGRRIVEQLFDQVRQGAYLTLVKRGRRKP